MTRCQKTRHLADCARVAVAARPADPCQRLVVRSACLADHLRWRHPPLRSVIKFQVEGREGRYACAFFMLPMPTRAN